MRSLAFTLLALLLLLRATAAADSSTATARARFERGQALYRSGRYAAAGAAFREAFAIDRQPRYLYNAAQALRRAGDCAGARELYEAFARIAPDADSSAAAARNLERCAPASTAPAPQPDAPALQPAASAPPTEMPAAAPEPPAPPTAPAQAPPPPPSPAASAPPAPPAIVAPSAVSTSPRRSVSRPWLPAAGGAATGAALVTASILEATAAARFDELRRTCAPLCSAADVTPLRRQLDAATGLFVVSGIVATATIIALVVTRARAH